MIRRLHPLGVIFPLAFLVCFLYLNGEIPIGVTWTSYISYHPNVHQVPDLYKNSTLPNKSSNSTWKESSWSESYNSSSEFNASTSPNDSKASKQIRSFNSSESFVANSSLSSKQFNISNLYSHGSNSTRASAEKCEWKNPSGSKNITRHSASYSCLKQLPNLNWKNETWWFPWNAPDTSLCYFQKLKTDQIRKRVKGAWIVFIGDSQARLLHGHFLRLLVPTEQFHYGKAMSFDYQTYFPSLDLYVDFLYRCYPENVTHELVQFKTMNACPDMMIFSVTLWHMLWITDDNKFKQEVREIKSMLENLPCRNKFWAQEEQLVRGRKSAYATPMGHPNEEKSKQQSNVLYEQRLPPPLQTKNETSKPMHSFRGLVDSEWKISQYDGKLPIQSYVQRNLSVLVHLNPWKGYKGDGLFYWVNAPTLVSWKFNTLRKREIFTPWTIQKYETATVDSGIYYPDGPCVLLDLRLISERCGKNCTVDGVHYNTPTIIASLQIMLNSFSVSEDTN